MPSSHLLLVFAIAAICLSINTPWSDADTPNESTRAVANHTAPPVRWVPPQLNLLADIQDGPAARQPATGHPNTSAMAAQERPGAATTDIDMLTMENLIDIAAERNPTLVQARMAIRSSEGEFVQESLYPNPVLGYVADEIGNEGTEGLNGLSVSQEIVTRGKLRLAQAIAGHANEQARWSFESQQYRVVNDVRTGFYDVLLAQKTVDVNHQLVRIGDEGARVAEQLLVAKAVSRPDLLQAQIEADTARLSLRQAQNDCQAAWRRLAAVVGRPDLEIRPLIGDIETNLPQFTWDESIARLLAQSPVLARAQAGVERARCDLSLQCAKKRPNFEIQAAAKYDTGSYYTVADIAVAIPLPIINRNQGNIIGAQARLIAAQSEVERTRLSLQNQLADVFRRYIDARQQVEIYKDSILPNANKSLELTSAGYREGEYDYLTLLMAQRTFFNASLTHLSGLDELWARSVEIEGMLLSGGLTWQP